MRCISKVNESSQPCSWLLRKLRTITGRLEDRERMCERETPVGWISLGWISLSLEEREEYGDDLLIFQFSLYGSGSAYQSGR